jgi:hypothetical protein
MRETDRDRESRTDERRQNKIFAQKRTREANRTNHKKTKSGRCCVREKQQQQKNNRVLLTETRASARKANREITFEVTTTVDEQHNKTKTSDLEKIKRKTKRDTDKIQIKVFY